MHRFYKCFLFLFFLLVGILIFGQINFSSNKLTKVSYEIKSHGNKVENQDPIWVFATPNQFLITTENQWNSKANFPFEMSFVDYSSSVLHFFSYLKDQKVISTVEKDFENKYEFELSDEITEILGYKCKKAKTIVNSNTIEIYYTDELKAIGGPTLLGSHLGLVLKYVRNGNFEIEATKIKTEKIQLPKYLQKIKPEVLDKLEYQDQIWKSRFTQIPLFENQQINFSEKSDNKKDVFRYGNGTVVFKKVKFPKISSNQLLFLELTEKSLGDAYDRTGSVFMIPSTEKQTFLDAFEKGIEIVPSYNNGNGKNYQGIVATKNFEPLVELMRFFTPFGVHHFNDRVQLKDKVWQDSVYYRQEISSLASLFNEKEVYVGVFIGNYDKGGHSISAQITIHNDFEKENLEFQKSIPLFNTLNVLEMAGQEYSTLFDVEKGLMVEFELNEEIKNAQLRYITTGHGGWGNGDEFVPKKNTILLNDEIVFDFIPWREDCGSYRLYNPVSGNFPNGLSSSDYSRSNWCPATVTQPNLIDLGNLKAGKHKIQIKIPQGKPEGNSFSAWNVSGVLIGN